MLRPIMPDRTLLNRSIAFALGLLASTPASANPEGLEVVTGTVGMATPNTQTLEITNSPGAILNWQGFDIGAGEVTRFIQETTASAVLNRVTTQNSSEIFGQLLSNGHVFLLNSAGILIGRDAVVDTAGLVLSTLNITDADFTAGRYKFEGGATSGSITNHGYIKSAPNGEIILIAPKILNVPLEGNVQSGLIESENGDLVLAAGFALTISSLDDPNVSFEVQAPENEVINIGQLLAKGGTASLLAGTIKHSGEINADALSRDDKGRIVLSATHRIETTADSVISARGEALVGEEPELSDAAAHSDFGVGSGPNAVDDPAALAATNPVGADGGEVVIKAALQAPENAQGTVSTAQTTILLAGRVDVTGRNGGKASVEGDTVTVSAKIDASGNVAGGTVHVLGDSVALEEATITANAAQGHGGQIRIGGEYQGGSALPAAETTIVDDASSLAANAGEDGHGGTIVTWSNEETNFKGSAEARGGAQSGDGGLVEVSGKEILRFAGNVDVGAPAGKGGTLLLDPRTIFIIPGGASVSVDNPTPFAGDQFGSSFSVLVNGNILVINQNSDVNGAIDAGEIVLLDSFGSVLGSLSGSAANQRLGAFGFLNIAGNLLIRDPNASNGGATQAGALILFNDDMGLEIGRLMGQSANENFGTNVTNLGTTFLVRSQFADVGGNVDAGAVVLGSGLTGLEIGRVSGSAAGDQFGSQVDFVGAGAYLIRSNLADVGGLTNSGTAVLTSRTTGLEIGRTSGLASNDMLGTFGPIFSGANYFLQVPSATVSGNMNAGSLVLVDGATGQRIGSADGNSAGQFFAQSVDNFSLGAGNTLVISALHDNGALVDAGGVFVIANTDLGGGNIVRGSTLGISANERFGQNGVEFFNANALIIRSELADTAGGIDAGSVVAINRATGALAGRVDGTSANERLGSFGLTQRSNGNYYIPSPLFDTGGGVVDAGSMILVDGTTGNILCPTCRFDGNTAGEQFGLTRFDNSLFNGDILVVALQHAGGAGLITQLAATDLGGGVIQRGTGVQGSTAGDLTGSSVVFRPFGNYLVRAPNADVSSNVDAGSVFAVEDSTGTVRIRIDGDQTNERLGTTIQTNIFDTLGGTLADTFAILSPGHGANSEGAIFFVNSEAGVLTRQIDGNTSETLGTRQLEVVPGGNIAIRSPFTSTFFADEGDITFVDAFNNFVTTGSISGISANEQLGGANTTIDTSSLGGGNFLINTPDRDVSGNANAGAVLLLNGVPGSVTLLGAISGAEANDRMGEDNAVQLLSNGNFVIFNPGANRDLNADLVNESDVGTIVLASSAGAEVDRIYGQSANERLGDEFFVFESFSGNGNYFAASPQADPGGIADAGSLYLASGTTGTLLGQADGDTANERFGQTFDPFALGNGDGIIRSAAGHGGGGTVVQVADVDLGSGAIIRGRIDGAVGGGLAEGLGTFGITFAPNGLHYFVRSPNADAGGNSDAGSVYFVNIATGALTNRMDGTSAGENFGSFGNSSIFQFGSNLFVTSEAADVGGAVNAGRVALVDSTGAVIGNLFGNNTNELLGSNFQFAGSDIWLLAPLHSNGGATGAGAIFAFANQDLGGGNIVRSSLQGGAANDNLGSLGVNFVAGGNAFVRVPLADAGGVTDAGTAILVNSSLQEIGRTNGTSANEQFSSVFFTTLTGNNFLFRSANADINGVVDAGTVKLVSGTTGTLIGETSGTSANEQFGANFPLFLINNGLAIVSQNADAGGLVDTGAIVQIDPTTGLELQRVVGLSANERLGSFGSQSLSAGRRAFGSPLADVNGITDSGRIVIFDPATVNQGGTATNLLFSNTPGGDFVVTTGAIENALKSGANLILQANTDIVIQKGATINADDGNLTLQAGRSIIVNGLINIPASNLVLQANAVNEAGFDPQNRDAGSGDFFLGDPQVIARTVDLSAENVVLEGGSDPNASFDAQSTVDFFDNFLNTGALTSPSTFVLGLEALNVEATTIALRGGDSPGAFAALVSLGTFKIDATDITLTPGTGQNADAVILALGGQLDIKFDTCTGCGDESDPFLNSGSGSGIFTSGLLEEPAVDAILSMLDRANPDDEDDEEDDDDDVRECGI